MPYTPAVTVLSQLGVFNQSTEIYSPLLAVIGGGVGVGGPMLGGVGVRANEWPGRAPPGRKDAEFGWDDYCPKDPAPIHPSEIPECLPLS